MKMIRTLFTEAVLIGAKFQECDLTDASMDKAKLSAAMFTGAILHGVDFSNSEFRGTCFMGCEDLHQANGLADVRHRMPWRGGIRLVTGCADASLLRSSPSQYFPSGVRLRRRGNPGVA